MGSMHWLTGLIYSDKAKKREEGRAEFLRVVQETGSAKAAAKKLKTTTRTFWRWADELGIPRDQLPDGREKITTADAQAAFDKHGSVVAAAEALGVSRTTIARRIGLLKDNRSK